MDSSFAEEMYLFERELTLNADDIPVVTHPMSLIQLLDGRVHRGLVYSFAAECF